MSQDDILSLIYQKGELTSKDIINSLNLAKSTVSAELGRLRKKKLIILKKGENNRLKIFEYKEN